MIVNCPHCNKKFNPKKAIVRDSKAKYKWYEFSGKHTFCPHCGKRFQIDVTGKAALVILVVFLFFIALESFGYWYAGVALICILIYAVDKKPNLVLKIERKQE